MSAGNIESVTISVGYDGTSVTKGLDALQTRVKSFASSALRYLAPVTAVFASGRLLANFVDTRNLSYLSNTLNESIEELSAWGNAARNAGGSAEGLRNTIAMLTRDVSNINRLGVSRSAGFLRFLGISAVDASGKIKSATDILLELADVAERMDTRQFVGIAQRIGIDSGTIQLLIRGRRAVEDLVSAEQRFATTTEDALAAQEFYKAINDISNAAQFAANRLIRVLVPGVQAISKVFTESVVYLNENRIAAYGLAAALGVIASSSAANSILSIAKAAGGLSAAFRGVVTRAIGPFGIATLGFLIADDIYKGLSGAESYTREFLNFLETAFPRTYNFLSNINRTFWDNLYNGIKLVYDFLSGTLLLPGEERTPEDIAVAQRELETANRNITDLYDPAVYYNDILNSPYPPIPSNTNVEMNVDNININTQATDANGIAGGIIGGMTTELYGQVPFVNKAN